MGNVDEKVELENVYWNGCDIRATGGTCELRGKVIVGVAATTEPRTVIAAKADRIAIFS